MTDPIWLSTARKYLGLKETAGPQNNPTILRFLDEADGKAGDGKTVSGIRDDLTPWCATFVSAVLEESHIRSTRSAWARSYLNFGNALGTPGIGAIAVLERGPTSGHVTFVVGRDAAGNIMCLGGNQSDMVRISAFDPKRVLSYRWPSGFPWPSPLGLSHLPVVAATGNLGGSET